MAPPSRSRLGRGMLPFSLSAIVAVSPQLISSRAAGRDIAPHQVVDRRRDGGALADDAAIRPFDPAIAERDVGLAEHHQPPLEAAAARDLFEALACCGI